MTANQVHNALEHLGLTKVGAAALFRVTERTVRRWADEGTDGPVVILLLLLLDGKITIDDLAC